MDKNELIFVAVVIVGIIILNYFGFFEKLSEIFNVF